MQTGDVFGHYRIVEPLGKGGMGEVFVAEDTRLNRRVALKVLPAVLAADSDARQRFEREAQAVAALNHPNIVTIHSVEEHEGRLFITMELVDGRPLGDEIPRGGMPLDRLLRIGIEVADAISAAQHRGITHRDLKPANIILTPSGRPKVLDFGLAKIRDAAVAGAGEDLTRMSSRNDLTGEGRIIGTVAYMSPEQAEGKAVDPRSDIFSVGVVLHEMATGQRPFTGDTNVSILSAIIKDTPPPVTDSNPALPADLARIVRRCLAKDPERRYQTAADLRNELEDLKQDTASGTVMAPRRPAAPRSRRRLALAAIAGGILAVAAGLWTLSGGRRNATVGSTGPFTIDRLVRLTTTGSASMAAISPDGRYVAHVKGEADGVGLWMRQTAAASDVRIVAPAPVRFDGVTFGPDGNYVYYSYYASNSGLASLFRVPVLGGTPSRIIEDLDSPITFSPDGSQIAFMRGAPSRGTVDLVVADADGRNARPLASANDGDRFQAEGPAWSPDGTTIVLTAESARPGIPAVLYAVDVASRAARPIGEPWGFVRDPRWLPGGRGLLVTGLDLSGMPTPQIWQVDYPSAVRTRVTNDLNSYSGMSIATDGRTAATVQGETVAHLYVTDPSGKEPRRITSGTNRADGVNGMTWLPDGRIVYSSTASGLPQLWISNSDGSDARQLTTATAPAQFPSSAPDGHWIYFTTFAKEGVVISRIAPDGSGLQQLTTDGDSRNPIASPDGKTIYLTATRSGVTRLMKMPAGGGTREPVTDKYFRAQIISFDGARMLGFTWSEERRRSEAAILTLATGAIESLPATVGTLFMPDGGLAFVKREQGMSGIVAQPAGGGPPRTLAPPHEDAIFAGAVAADGRILFSRGTSTTDVVLIKAK